MGKVVVLGGCIVLGDDHCLKDLNLNHSSIHRFVHSSLRATF